MEKIKTIRIQETDSTNRWLREYSGEEGGRMTVVVADNQTAGCGQGTNRWESEPGKNLLFSVKFRPEGIPAARNFVLLEAAAIAARHAIATETGCATIKWPNDIYVGDRKISGTLSECRILGGLVQSCIVGIGINVNQTVFTSDAPNPVSIRNLTGRETDKQKVLDNVLERLDAMLTLAGTDSGRTAIHNEYTSLLYRKEGTHCYRDAQGVFDAIIDGIEPDGHLLLRRTDGTVSRYAFKEVTFVIPPSQTHDITSKQL